MTAEAVDLVVVAERAVLGALMVSIDDVPAADVLEPGDFYRPTHGAILTAIRKARTDDQAPGPVVVGEVLHDAGDLARVGGVEYLTGLVSAAMVPGSIERHVRVIRRERARRERVSALVGLHQIAEDDDAWSARSPDLIGRLNGDVSPADRLRRRVNLLPFLDGTYNPPPPQIGGDRDDNQRLLYPGRWHTLVAPTAAGKSWFAVWHVVAELRRGNTVGYAHFEEHNPAGMLDRIRALAPDLTTEDLIERFIWLDCSRAWKSGEFAEVLPAASLIVLDGIVAACSQHGLVADKPEAVGAYRELFVTPATKTGAAVISLGHPVKARDRQTERHGFGASAWLDEVDGAGFRMEASKSPIRRGQRGYSALFTVKDRYGLVELAGRADAKRDGWFYLGAFTVDSSPSVDNTVAHLTAPSSDTAEGVAAASSMPVVIMAAISAELAKQGHALSQHAVMALVPGKTDVKRAALEFLVNGEYVVQSKRGNTLLHRHHKPFHLDGEDESDD
nr:DnaB-like helicase N-terminal domain-containing protein [Micromonospora sp. DSM 115978]